MKRPILRVVPISGIFHKPEVMVTMSIGQWDRLLSDAYESWVILLELDSNEQLVRAYQKEYPDDTKHVN